MRHKVARIILGFWIIVISVVLFIKWYSMRQADAYSGLLSGNVGLLRVEFDGQERHLNSDDSSVMEDFQKAFKRSEGRGLIAGNPIGHLYYAVFVLKTGVTIKTEVFFAPGRHGFSMHDYSQVYAGDPRSVGVEFDTNINKGTQDLLGVLPNPP